jgi:hypothetical protein
MKGVVGWFVLMFVLAGCENAAGHATLALTDSMSVARSDSISRARQDSINRAQPGYVIDSLLPVDEEIRRFKLTVGGWAASMFSGGASSRDSLLRLFANALERRDTAALVRALITPREFIDLYYPGSPYTQAPYRQSPGFLWSQLSLASSKGLSRLMERRGGTRLGALGLVCDAKVQHQGANRIWNQCEVQLSGSSRRERLFGSIIERNGRYKFLSYSNGY